MKKIIKCLIPTSLIACTVPMCTIATSCNQSKENKYEVFVVNKEYLTKDVEVSKIYVNSNFTISFELNDKCFIDPESSYIYIENSGIYSFNDTHITSKVENNKYTYTVNKDIVLEGSVYIYINLYKVHNIDITKNEGITYSEIYTPTVYDKQAYTIGFKVDENKALDWANSSISIDNVELSLDASYVYEEIIDDTTYTFITIPSALVVGNIKLNLKATEGVKVSISSHPEYSVTYLSNTAKNQDFVCNFYLTSSTHYALDTDNALIKVGDVVLTKDTHYAFTKSGHHTTLTINAEKVTDAISIDVPTIECYTLHSSIPGANRTVLAVGDKIVKNKEYSFKVYPLDGKDIDFDNDQSYILINDEQIKKDDSGANGFKVEEGEVGYTITVPSKYAIANMYCHFITK